MMPIALLGVDGGGTRTRATVLRLPGGEIATGEAGPSNWSAATFSECSANILVAAYEALGRRRELDGVAICSAGFHPVRHTRLVNAWVEMQWPQAKIALYGDMMAAHAGAFAGGPGIVVIAGTGSIVLGQRADHQEARAGGRGELFGDVGSGSWLGRQALIAVGEAEDGVIGPTRLTEALVALRPEWGDAGEAWLRGAVAARPDRRAIAALAPAVLEAAKQGDETAGALLAEAAARLGGMVLAVSRRLGTELPVAGVGGVFAGDSPVLADLRAWLQERGWTAPVERPRLEPRFGAVMLAARRLGAEVEAAARERLLGEGVAAK